MKIRAAIIFSLLLAVLCGCGGAKETPAEAAPTAAPVITAAPTEAPTATPAPTQAPTATPVPTATPEPTQVPTATPEPTAVPTPDNSYTIALTGNTAIYHGPDPDFGLANTVGADGVYTIVDEQTDEFGDTWGYLKSGAGWVNLSSIRAGMDSTHPVSSNFADDAFMAAGGYEYYIYQDNANSVNVVFEASRRVWDLSFAAMGSDGSTPGSTLYSIHRLDGGSRFVVKVDFTGDTTAYALTLTDGGFRRSFAVTLSGRESTPQCWEITF